MLDNYFNSITAMIKTKNPSLLLQFDHHIKKNVFKWLWYSLWYCWCFDGIDDAVALYEISDSRIILSFMLNGLSHTIDIFFAFVLTLFKVDIWDNFLPSCLLIELLVLLSQFLFFFDIFFGPLLLFFLFFVQKLL